MKKLLLIAILMLAMVFTVVACNNDKPAETTAGETTATQAPATEPEATTVATETPTEPEVTTVAPEVPTEAPETTVAAEVPTEPAVTTAEPETTADPMDPVNVFEAADITTVVGGDPNNLTQDCVTLEDGYLHIDPLGPDPYYYPFMGVDGARYVAIRYRTDATNASMQLYIASSGTGPSDDTTMIQMPIVADSEWNLIVFDTQSLIDAGKYDGSYVSYLRFDPLEAGYVLDENGQPYKDAGGQWVRYTLPENCTIDVAYIGFFNSVEAAEKYDFEKYPPYVAMDDAAAGKVNHSFDTFFVNDEMYFPEDGGAGDKLAAQNNTVEFELGAAHNSMSLRGWIGFAQPIASFGYYVDTYTYIWGEFAQATEDGVKAAGGEHASRFKIDTDISALMGEHKVGYVVKLEDGTVVLLMELTVVIPDRYENLIVPQEQWVISGHNNTLNDSSNPMVAAGGLQSGALLHQGSISLGEIDLSKYDKVIVYVGMDNSQVTIDAHAANAANGNRLMLVSADMNNVMSPEAETIIASVDYTPMGWAVVAYEIDLTGVDYNGPVYFTYDTLPGTFLLVGSVEFVGAKLPEKVEEPEVPEPDYIAVPSAPDEPAVVLDVTNFADVFGSTAVEPQNFGNLAVGSGFSYFLNVPADGTYSLTFYVSTPHSEYVDDLAIYAIHGDSVDYANLKNSDRVGIFFNDQNTGGWTNFVAATPVEVYLKAGEQYLVIKSMSPHTGYINVSKLELAYVSDEKPADSTIVLPSQTDDTVLLNNKNATIFLGNVKVEEQNFGELTAGAGFGYEIKVDAERQYELTFRVATPGEDPSGALQIYLTSPAADEGVDGATLLGEFVNDKGTGWWLTFDIASPITVTIPAGHHGLVFYVASGTACMNVADVTVRAK